MKIHWNRLGLVVCFGLLFGMLGCPGFLGGSATVAYVDVSVEAAHQLVADGIFVLDVRTAEEFAEGHIPGATNISSTELAERLEELSGRKDTPMLVYCRTGVRSAVASQLLSEAGFQQVNNMLDGFNAWRDAGYDVE